MDSMSVCFKITPKSKAGGSRKAKSRLTAEIRTPGARGGAGRGGQLVGSENRVAPGQHRPIVTQISATPLLSSFPAVLLRSGGQRVRGARRVAAHMCGGKTVVGNGCVAPVAARH